MTDTKIQSQENHNSLNNQLPKSNDSLALGYFMLFVLGIILVGIGIVNLKKEIEVYTKRQTLKSHGKGVLGKVIASKQQIRMGTKGRRYSYYLHTIRYDGIENTFTKPDQMPIGSVFPVLYFQSEPETAIIGELNQSVSDFQKNGFKDIISLVIGLIIYYILCLFGIAILIFLVVHVISILINKKTSKSHKNIKGVVEMKYTMAIIACIAEGIVYAIIGALLGWEKGGGIIPMMILFAVWGTTWQMITKAKLSENKVKNSQSVAYIPKTNHESGCPDYAEPHELRIIWNRYSDQWPDNSERYDHWKPESILPAPKWAIKQAMKLCYAEWPEPIDKTVFSAFFMEFVDLALHLPQEKYEAIEKFRKQRIKCCGEEDGHDPLLMFRLPSSLATAWQIEHSTQKIIQIQDGLRRSPTWDPVGVEDKEIDAVRQILLESTTEFATLIEEWRFYILSIGRDQYVK